jgi:hypothetical protein
MQSISQDKAKINDSKIGLSSLTNNETEFHQTVRVKDINVHISNN